MNLDSDLMAFLDDGATPVAASQQGDAAWMAQRVGCLTASRFADAIDRLKLKKDQIVADLSAACKDYIAELVSERATGIKTYTPTTFAMQHGIDCEPAARAAYVAATGNAVELAGFVLHPTIERFGASPDGTIGDDGLLEIKCPSSKKFVSWVEAGVVPDEHKPQMLAQIACTGRGWVDFAAYDPRIKEPSERLFVRRYTPTVDEVKAAEAQAVEFLAAVAAFDARRVAMTMLQTVPNG